jgi:MFS family permease
MQRKLSISAIGMITSAAFIGMFVGALCGGWFSDWVGRQKALIATTVWYSASSLKPEPAFLPDGGLHVGALVVGLQASAVAVYQE